ncbi:MAG: protein-glutamate O-methyltransferase CheR [Bacteroidales bacterium]|nr:protein-glutamate O-methyltransferase CheR [Bacteroidales bacterium]
MFVLICKKNELNAAMEIKEDEIKDIVKVIYDLSGYDFSDYSPKSLLRRFEKILIDYQCTMPELISKLKTNPLLIESIVKNITVNTTEFFRDPLVWIEFEEKVIPELKKHEQIKIWHPGCSLGHEPYSMLIMLNEHQLLDKAEIIATDLNSDVLATAKNGIFRYFLDIEYLKNFDSVINRDPLNYKVPYDKYFDLEASKDIFKIKSEFLGKIKFYKHNLVQDPFPHPDSFDLIMCRNVLIYFNMELQNKIIYNFYKSLKLNSYLILGYHESILGSLSNFFDKNGQVYKKSK